MAPMYRLLRNLTPMFLCVVACTTSPNAKIDTARRFEDPSKIYDFKGGNIYQAAFAAGLSLYALATSEDSAGKVAPLIFGQCKTVSRSVPKFEEACPESYVVFKDDSTNLESKIWVDNSGYFSFPIRPFQSFTVYAVNDIYKIRSK